uniref:Cytochrome P450 n=1 Tax=Ditylum brightwellii TaxID=49249 RepID=A0A7S4W4H5_9STRA
MIESFPYFLSIKTLFILLFLKVLHRLYQAYQRSRRLKESLPFPNIPYTVPNPHWYFGHLRAIGSDVVRGQEHLCVTYASPNGISTFWTINRPSLSFLRADDINQVLRYSFHRQHVPSLAFHFKKLLGQHSLIMTVGKEWMSNRAIVQRAFTPASLRDCKIVMCDVSRRFVRSILLTIRRYQRITAVAEDEISDNENVNPDRSAGKWILQDISPLLKSVTIDVFGLAAFGHDFNSTSQGRIQEPLISKSFNFLSDDMVRRTFDLRSRFNPAAQYYYIPTSLNRQFKKENKALRDLLLDVIQKKRLQVQNQEQDKKDRLSMSEGGSIKMKKEKHVDDLLTRLLRVSLSSSSDDKKGGFNLTDEYLSDFLLTLLFAGHDTTCLSLIYALYLLARHPEQEKRCVEEARSVLGWKNTNCHNKESHHNIGAGVSEDDNEDFLLPPAPRRPSSTNKGQDAKEEGEDDDGYVIDSIKELPYTHAVMLESIRLYPPVTNSIRDLGRDMEIEIDGKKTTIHTGTRVFMSFYWIHRHPENFERPAEFLPERWVRWNKEQKRWEERDPDDEIEKEMAKKKIERRDKEKTSNENESDHSKNTATKDSDVSSSNYISPGLRSNLLSFAAGGRSCVGVRFALQETPIILAYFVRDIKAELADEDFELELARSGPNQKPKDGVPMVLSRRF